MKSTDTQPANHLAAARTAYGENRLIDAEAALRRLEQELGDRADSDADLLRLQGAAWSAYGRSDMVAFLDRQRTLIPLLEERGESVALADALILDATARMSANLPGVDDQLAAGLAYAKVAGDFGLQARAWATLAMVEQRRNRSGEAIIAASAASAAAHRSEAWRWVAAAERTRSAALAELGDLESATRSAFDALRAAVSAGQTSASTDLRLQLILLLIQNDEFERATDELRSATLALPHPPGRQGPMVLYARARLLFAMNDLDGAADAGHAARDGWRQLGDPLQEATALLLLVLVELERGDVGTVHELLAEPGMVHAPPALDALTRARVAAAAGAEQEALDLALTAAQEAKGRGAQAAEDKALRLAVTAAYQTGNLSVALQMAMRLADARRRHSRRLQQVRAAAMEARRQVFQTADPASAAAGLPPDGDAEAAFVYNLLERTNQGVRDALATVAASAELLASPEPQIRRDRLLEQLMVGVRQADLHLDRAMEDARQSQWGPEDSKTRLTSLAHRVVARYADEAQARDIQLQVRAPVEITAHASPRACREAFCQLVRNGVLYCRPGDTVRISITAEEAHAVVRVEDDGPGMPAKRVEAMQHDRPEEAGLGLSLVHRAVTGVGGTIKLTSAANTGTQVELRFRRG